MSEEMTGAGAETSNEAPAPVTGGQGQATAADPAAPQGVPAEAGAAEKPSSGSSGTLMGGAEDQKPAEGGDEKKPEDEKPKGAPESYEDFKAPEGTEFAAPVVDAFKGVAKELDLSQDQAQKLIDTMTPVMQARYAENIQRISADWAERSKADPEIGGEHFKTSMASVARVREAFARNPDGTYDADILEFMNSPMGNHPGALRLLARAGAAIGEGGFPTGGKAVSGPYAAKDFYKDALHRG